MKYENQSLKDLRRLAEERNISTEGTRRELAQRLYEEEYKDVPVRYVPPATDEPVEPVEVTVPLPSDRYTPTAWVEGSQVKVAFQFNGRITHDRHEYFVKETLLHAHHLGQTVVSTPGLKSSQGAHSMYAVEIKTEDR